MSIETINDDIVLSILQFVSPLASARLGLANKKWMKKILTDEESCGLSQKLWETFAIHRWGNAASLDNDGDDDIGIGNISNRKNDSSSWYQYYRHRCSWWKSPPQISHLDLIQEYYAEDPYRLLTACILCSRTSGSQVIRQVVHNFMEKYPTPTCVVDADISDMATELHALGLNRGRTMKRFAAGFLKQWKEVTELHGCGAFAASSFDIFCRGDCMKVLKDKKADRNVKAYASFIKSMSDGGKGKEDDKARECLEAKASRSSSKRRSLKQGNELPEPVRKMTRSRRQRVTYT